MINLAELRISCLRITNNDIVKALALEKRQLEWLLSDMTISHVDRNKINDRFDQVKLTLDRRHFDTLG